MNAIASLHGEETELHFSNRALEPNHAVLIASSIKRSALSHLSLSNNQLTRGALKEGKKGGYDSHYETDLTGWVV
jgi:hypothetical protein